MDLPPKQPETAAPDAAPAPEKPVKEKKPRSEAQKATTQKALAALTAARKAKAEKQKEKKEELKIAKKAVEEKILNNSTNGFVVKEEFDVRLTSLQNQFAKDLAELKAAYATQKTTTAAPKQEKIVERVIERVPTSVAAPPKLTGNALLDRVFGFDK